MTDVLTPVVVPYERFLVYLKRRPAAATTVDKQDETRVAEAAAVLPVTEASAHRLDATRQPGTTESAAAVPL